MSDQGYSPTSCPAEQESDPEDGEALLNLSYSPTREQPAKVEAGYLLRVKAGYGTLRFQCPECGLGDHEIGPMAGTEIHCVVCLEEEGRLIRVHCWEEETDHARLREALVAA
jgi:hypothetical protein